MSSKVRFPGLTIQDLALANELESSMLVETETATGSKSVTIGAITAFIGRDFYSRVEINQKLAEKLNVNGQVEDSAKLEGKTLAQIQALFEEITVNNSTLFGGRQPNSFASQADLDETNQTVAEIVLLLKELFESLNDPAGRGLNP